MEELRANKIDHALMMTGNCSSGTHVYPAFGNTGTCADPTNAAPLGAQFQLDLTPAQIDSINVPIWHKTILKAMAQYGMFFGDGGGNMALEIESGRAYTAYGYPDKTLSLIHI